MVVFVGDGEKMPGAQPPSSWWKDARRTAAISIDKLKQGIYNDNVYKDDNKSREDLYEIKESNQSITSI